MKSKMVQRIFRSLLPGIFGMCFGILFLAFVASGGIYDFKDSVQENQPLPSVDVIVCLAGGRGRIAEAGEVWLRYYREAGESGKKVPLLYISGMGPKADWKVLNQHLSEAVKAEIKTENVFFETESIDTRGNAALVADFMAEEEGDRILIITSSYHVRRSLYLFEQLLPRDRVWKIYTHAVYAAPYSAEHWRSQLIGIQVTMTAYLKWVFTQAFF